MTHIVAALFFTLALLGACVALHTIVRFHWTEIMLALRGELGLEVRSSAALGPERAPAMRPWSDASSPAHS